MFLVQQQHQHQQQQQNHHHYQPIAIPRGRLTNPVKLPRIEPGGLIMAAAITSSSMTSSPAPTTSGACPKRWARLQVASMANELATQLLISQPANIPAFCAEYLEKKLEARNREKEKVMRLRRRSFARKKERIGGSMLLATGRYDPATTREGVMSGMQDFDPLKEQVRLPETGGRGISSERASQAIYNSPETPCRLVLDGHTGTITQSCTIDSYIVTASLDKSVRIWEASTGDLVSVFSCHQAVLSFLCVRIPGSMSRALLLAGCSDGRVPAWTLDFEDGEVKTNCVNVFACHLPNPIRAMAVSPDRRHLATGCCFLMNQICLNRTRQVSVRGTLKTWDMDKVIRCAIETKSVEQNISHQSMRTMKQLAAAVISRKTSYSRNALQFDEEKYFGIRAIAYTPDSSKVVVGFGHPDDLAERDFKMTVVCCAETLTTLWADQDKRFQMNGLAFSHHGLGTVWMPWHLLVSSQGSLQKLEVFVKDISSSGRTSVRVRCAWQRVFQDPDNYHACLSPDGALVATACGDTVCVWDWETGNFLASYEGHEGKVVHVRFSRDGHNIYSTSTDCTCRVWRVPTRDYSGSDSRSTSRKR